ncbi:uncharacterized protein LOC120669579 [Panicum virgatum]|uniref:Uncharacterized protein n=1 Tax=Panicum virgatum TaxID=38727 RepID=A0A8T0T151_PANVG|nr:uncharacterized protein LOC120669579 [Panicum virgatum]KAG2604861.1 hypothetical protein PVAP13_4NG164100 [Panicum virgatum]
MQFRVAPSSRRRATQQAGGGGRRKRMAVVRLGGGGGGGRKRRLFGTLRLRWPWLAAVYRRALRRLRASYEQALRELVEGTALVGALHAPAGVDCAHAASFGPMATVGF